MNKTIQPAPPTPVAAESGWSAVKATWSQPARWFAVIAAIAPGAVFVLVDSLSANLTAAIGAAGLTALLVLAVRLLRHESLRSALVGAAVVAACAVVAEVTGEARGFFLLPTLIPFAVVAVCLTTIVIRRPLTGLILNRVTGGPSDWPNHRRLLRVHTIATSVAVAVNVVNGALQVTFYSRSDTAVLALAHAATGPIFATLVAVTVVAARKAISSAP